MQHIAPFSRIPHSDGEIIFNQAASHIYNDAPCLYAATSSGLMRSEDGKKWENAALRGHTLDGLAVWQGAVYMASLRDGNIYTMDARGQIRAAAAWKDIGFPARPMDCFCLFDLGVDGLLCIADAGNARFFCALYNGAGWIIHTAPDQFSSPRRKLAYLAPYAYGIANSRLFFLDARKFAAKGVCQTELEIYDIAELNGELYAVTGDGIRRIAHMADDTVALDPVCEQPWKGAVCHFFFDAHGDAIVVCNNRTFISRDLMQSWTGCDTPFIDDSAGLLVIFGNSVFATGRDPGASIPPRSGWCVWDM